MTADREFHDAAYAVASHGPFHRYPVTVNGWTVPHLEAKTRPDGAVTVTLDHRFDIDLPADVAGTTIAFIADCVAVAKGYACHPRIDGWDRVPHEAPSPPRWPWVHMVGLTDDEAP